MKHNHAGGGRLLRGSAQLAAIAVVSAVVGVALGVGLSKLSGDDDVSGQIGLASTNTTRGSQTGSATRTSTTAASGADDNEDALKKVRVSVRSAVLNTAATPSGISRNRARLSVRVKIQNRSRERVTLARPTLLAADQRQKTDPQADSADTRVEALEASRSATVTLIFETAGDVTEELKTQQTARIVVAGRSRSVSIEVGDAVEASDSGSG